MREQAAADATTPTAGVDVEDIELGFEMHIGVARRSANAEADNQITFDRDEDGPLRGRVV